MMSTVASLWQKKSMELWLANEKLSDIAKEAGGENGGWK